PDAFRAPSPGWTRASRRPSPAWVGTPPARAARPRRPGAGGGGPPREGAGPRRRGRLAPEAGGRGRGAHARRVATRALRAILTPVMKPMLKVGLVALGY